MAYHFIQAVLTDELGSGNDDRPVLQEQAKLRSKMIYQKSSQAM